MAELTPQEDSPLTVTISKEAEAPVVALCGELDLATVEIAAAEVEPSLAGRPERVVFDVSALRFMDSSGIAFLLSVARRAERVELRGPSAAIRRLIEVTGLEKALPIVS
ncbi:MAG: STAS domain-containing protein [Acidimicrobiales bacterium]